MKIIPQLTPLVDISSINISLFMIKDQYFGQIYPFKTEEEVLNSLLREILYFNLNDEILSLFIEAWNSRFWINKGYDGATFIKNKKHTAIGNFIHDYMYRSGMGGYEADFIYKQILVDTGYKISTAKWRFTIITCAWWSYYKWKHMSAKNILPLTKKAKNTFNFFKKSI